MEVQSICWFIAILQLITCTLSDDTLTDTAIKTATETFNELQYLKRLYNKTVKEELALSDFKNDIRGKLIAKNSKYLANMLCGTETEDNKQRIKQYLSTLFVEHEIPIAENICRNAFNEAQSCTTFTQIVEVLATMFQQSNQGFLELMINIMDQLFAAASHTSAASNNMKFWKISAFILYKIKQDKSYASLNARRKTQIDKLLTKLPTNCYSLFFSPHFCLMNEKYSEYLYITAAKHSIDSTSRHVWGWHTKFDIDYMGPLEAIILEGDNKNPTDILFRLKGIEYPLYYYMMPQTKLIAAWESTSEPVNSIWDIKFLDDDRVALYQNGYIACFTDEKYNKERRTLRGYESEKFSSKSKECQWLLGICSRL